MLSVCNSHVVQKKNVWGRKRLTKQMGWNVNSDICKFSLYKKFTYLSSDWTDLILLMICRIHEKDKKLFSSFRESSKANADQIEKLQIIRI